MHVLIPGQPRRFIMDQIQSHAYYPITQINKKHWVLLIQADRHSPCTMYNKGDHNILIFLGKSTQKNLGVLRGSFQGFGCPKRHADALLAKTMAMWTYNALSYQYIFKGPNLVGPQFMKYILSQRTMYYICVFRYPTSQPLLCRGYFHLRYKDAKIFDNHLNPVMLLFIG